MLREKKRKRSKRMRKEEGKRKDEEPEPLAHGVDGNGSTWPRYWEFSGE
jgi:hypothetical protein